MFQDILLLSAFIMSFVFAIYGNIFFYERSADWTHMNQWLLKPQRLDCTAVPACFLVSADSLMTRIMPISSSVGTMLFLAYRLRMPKYSSIFSILFFLVSGSVQSRKSVPKRQKMDGNQNFQYKPTSLVKSLSVFTKRLWKNQ